MKRKKMSSCLACAFHRVISDPDPYDWFCDDDEAIVCTKTPNPDRKKNMASKYVADHSEFRVVISGVRPHHLERESSVPKWCPLL